MLNVAIVCNDYNKKAPDIKLKDGEVLIEIEYEYNSKADYYKNIVYYKHKDSLGFDILFTKKYLEHFTYHIVKHEKTKKTKIKLLKITYYKLLTEFNNQEKPNNNIYMTNKDYLKSSFWLEVKHILESDEHKHSLLQVEMFKKLYITDSKFLTLLVEVANDFIVKNNLEEICYTIEFEEGKPKSAYNEFEEIIPLLVLPYYNPFINPTPTTKSINIDYINFILTLIKHKRLI